MNYTRSSASERMILYRAFTESNKRTPPHNGDKAFRFKQLMCFYRPDFEWGCKNYWSSAIT